MEEQINKIAKKLQVPVNKLGDMPAFGNCWYEAIIFLMKKYGLEGMTVPQLRKEATEYIECGERFGHIMEYKFNNNDCELEEFKKKHQKNGTFTDMDGIMVLATCHLESRSTSSQKQTTKKTP